ncbi:MAG: anthranilate phosphoribosyltransferase, partial [Pseudomonadota bacterium]
MSQTDTRAAIANLRTCIQKVATGPEYSKDLSFEEARDGMAYILSGEADPVQAAVMLIGLRMKRETQDENRGVLQAIIDQRETFCANVDELIDIADPYNGHVRGLPAAPFIAPVLAACGVPAFSHGVETVGPKHGLTHHRVLRAAGIDVDITPKQLLAQLEDTDCGWGYIDQARFCPALYALVPLR